VAGVAGALLSTVAACNGLLGNRDAVLTEGGAADTRGADASGGGDARGPDAPGMDARGGLDVRSDRDSGDVVEAAPCSAPDTTADCGSGLVRCLPSGACGIDPKNDKNNCGECGRVCDGKCVGGTCVPTTIDTGSWAGSRVAWAGAPGVIWITGSTGSEQAFIELSEAGVQAVSGTDDVMADLAVDGTQDYVLENYEIDVNSIPDGTNLNVIAPGYAPGYALGPDGRITHDATRVYFTEGRSGGTVASVIKDGGDYVELASSQSHPSDIFVADAGVVFLNRATVGSKNGAILVIDPATPGTTYTKVHGLGPIGELVSTNDGSAFYALVRQGEIWHLDTSSFATKWIATWARVDHVAADATYVVFAGQPTSTSPLGIYRMARCGGRALPVMTDSALGATTGLALYGGYVYWSAAGGLYRTSR